MKVFRLLLLIVLLSVGLPLSAQDGDGDDSGGGLPGIPTVPDIGGASLKWETVEPGGKTTCARGTPYRFFTRTDADPDKLLIYFQGGGACWSALSCSPQNATFDEFVSTVDEELSIYTGGIFDVANNSNPLADYNIVYIPYCTGDVHVGDASVTYPGDITIEHRGAVNSQAALDWAYTNFESPSQVAVIGTSAGAYGSIYFAGQIMEQYPDARVVQVADAGVGTLRRGWPILEDWGFYENLPEWVDVDPAEFSINQLYVRYAETFPHQRFSQVTTANDEVQAAFYRLGSLFGPEWTDAMWELIDTLESNVPNFRAYIIGGDLHAILPRPEFYEYAVEGVHISDWLAALLNGEPVENLRCDDCTEPEILPCSDEEDVCRPNLFTP